MYPHALLSFRSALEFSPDDTGVIYLSGTTNRKIKFASLTLEFSRSPAALDSDPLFMKFRVSSLARAYLENLSTTVRTKNKSLPQEKIEERLEAFSQVKGLDELILLRKQAHTVAKKLKWLKEYKKLDKIIGALLGTQTITHLKSPKAIAQAKGLPYDSACNERLQNLFSDLKKQPLQTILEKNKSNDHFNNKAFFEAYFSNYIEGTTFEITEAEQIVFDRHIPQQRPKAAQSARVISGKL